MLYSHFKDFNMLMLQMEITAYKNKAHCVFEKKLLFYSECKYGVVILCDTLWQLHIKQKYGQYVLNQEKTQISFWEEKWLT